MSSVSYTFHICCLSLEYRERAHRYRIFQGAFVLRRYARERCHPVRYTTGSATVGRSFIRMFLAGLHYTITDERVNGRSCSLSFRVSLSLVLPPLFAIRNLFESANGAGKHTRRLRANFCNFRGLLILADFPARRVASNFSFARRNMRTFADCLGVLSRFINY